MTSGEGFLFIGLLINAGAIVYAARQGNKNTALIIGDVHKIETATNSMKDDLVRVTGEAAHAAGENAERLKGEAKAEALVASQQRKP